MMTFKEWQQHGDYFNYRQFDIFYRYQRHVTHDKPTLLLLHGFPTSSMDWHKIWDHLTPFFHVIAFDFLGYGSSDKPHNYDYSSFEQANICELLLDHLNITNCLVIAHDYGDTVLQELLARQNVGRLGFEIQKAAMLNGGIFIEANQPILIQRLMISPIGPLLGALNNRLMYGANLNRVFHNKLSKEEMNEQWEMTCYKRGRTLLPILQRYLIERVENRARWREALIEASCPLMFLSGDLDSISGKAMREYYEEHMPNAYTKAIDVAHYPQLEDPETTLTTITTFFAQAL